MGVQPLPAGTGHVLDSSAVPAAVSNEERRRKALEAAERRQNSAQGVSQSKVAEMRKQQQKNELLGKITEHYRARRLELPMGLNAASVAQLRGHWDRLRSGDICAEEKV